jgi:hypothetical protein
MTSARPQKQPAMPAQRLATRADQTDIVQELHAQVLKSLARRIYNRRLQGVQSTGFEPLPGVGDISYVVSETEQSFQLQEVRENGNALEQSFQLYRPVSLSDGHSSSGR